MEARILGAHQCEALGKRFTSILVDGRLAIDAGGLTSGLTLDEQLRIADVLLTHKHFDHVKDLGAFGFNLMGHHVARIHCTVEVRQAVSDYLLNAGYWLNFFDGPNAARPTFQFVEVQPGGQFAVGDYDVRSVPINHTIPAIGYHVVGPDKRSIYYTSDNGPGCGQHWATVQTDVLVTEVTYSNAMAPSAASFGHLTPQNLRAEVETYRAARGYIPRVLVVHVNPSHEVAIRSELAEVARAIGSPIEVAHEDQVVTI